MHKKMRLDQIGIKIKWMSQIDMTIFLYQLTYLSNKKLNDEIVIHAFMVYLVNI